MGNNTDELMKDTNKIVENILKLLVGPLNPWLEAIGRRRATKKDLKTVLDFEKVKKENPSLPIELSKNFLENSYINWDEDLIRRAQTRVMADEIRKQNNLEHIAIMTIEDLENQPKQNDIPIDEDFLSEFKEDAGRIHKEEMQRIWAKILANEIRNPGTYTPKDLLTLRSLNKELAQEFLSLVPYILGKENGDHLFLFGEADSLEKAGISYSFIRNLSQEGLLDTTSYYKVLLKCDEEGKLELTTHDLLFLIQTGIQNFETAVHIYSLTRIGKSIYSIMSPEKTTEKQVEILSSILSKLFSNSMDVKIEVKEKTE